MSISMINGYACFDCKDIARAKKGENPRSDPDAPKTDQANGGRQARDGQANGSEGAAGSPADPSTVSGASSTASLTGDGIGNRVDKFA